VGGSARVGGAAMKTLIRTDTWDVEGHRAVLQLWDTDLTDRQGKERLAYVLYFDGSIVFEGDDFFCSPLHSVDSDETVRSLMSFLTLRRGDTDAEYFESYTPEQIAFRDTHAESLSYAVLDWGAP